MAKLALISGGRGTLGAAFAKQLLSLGEWRVVLADNDPPKAQAMLARLDVRSGQGCEVRALNVSRIEEWSELIRLLQRENPKIDLLVNSAGVASGGEVHEVPPEEFQRVMQINYFGTLYGCQAVVPWMKSSGSGHIVNVASITGFLSPPATAAYASSKAAVIALSESLYAELRPHGIGVTVSVPGFFPSPLVERGTFSEESLRQEAQSYADRATLTADEVAEATLRAVDRKQLYAVSGSRARWYWRLKRLAPQWLANRLSKKLSSIN
ncbi:SDR family NAD(P)-dependent oxidoreductase [Adhaeretor mobilis]|uniref:SDR family NAD(P)-dependent oxidoreductase n=1 Tax=Adhaeretor mobilis TaxID=1930276 RepID=UPI001C54F56F|nr:SDR family NAD(P)-dependent oxidoreductase [Adhaeretor mobilis]